MLSLKDSISGILEVGIFGRSISTFSFSFCFRQACFSRMQKSLIPQKCLFPEQVACSTPTALLAPVAESYKKMLEGASPSPYLIFVSIFTQPQFEDCDDFDNYDVHMC